mmetsp:Transcript_53262/g.155144  ORF Transcript_53262/g.155144 Transcript_53262/m.155144 type:complete len:814 (-) Transcript_53262:68-2509(-)
MSLAKVVPADTVPPPPDAVHERPRKNGYRFACCLYERIPPAIHYGYGTAAPPSAEQSQTQLHGTQAVVPIGSAPITVPNGFFDAHAHLFNFSQHTEGIAFLLNAMDDCGVSHAALTGCPLKKNWSEFETRLAADPFNDTDILYYFSMTDMYVLDELKALPPSQASRFAPLICGFKPTDKTAPEQISKLIDSHPEIIWRGLGEVYLRGSELTNLTAGPVPHPGTQAFDLIMSEAYNRDVPILIHQKACSESVKPYKYGFDFLPELDACLQKFAKVKTLWVGAGIFERGQWQGYKDELDKLLGAHENLHISITPEILHVQKLKQADLVELAEKYPKKFMVGTSTMGYFSKQGQYKKDWDDLKCWLGMLSQETYRHVMFGNAKRFYGEKDMSRQRATKFHLDTEQFINGLNNRRTEMIKNQSLHDFTKAEAKDAEPPTEKHRSLQGMLDGKLIHDEEIKHTCIDTHLHMLDFLHKSSGTRRILEAMDGCGVEKAVLIGMPCCKKWSKEEPEKPLYYQDDNGQCYFYSYSDQMVADAWLALPMEKRARFAPIMASFNPTDINSIDHVQRMWDKYPGLWRGLGEVMCRHDDLTTLLQDDETPVINHVAMRPLYQFCMEHDINCLVHHNADRTAVRDKSSQSHYEYQWEVKQVLETFPGLKLIWCHAGASRRTHQDTHHEMIGNMLSTYESLMIDISWVVWEDVICEPGQGRPKREWVELFEAHPTRFTMGSDQVGQFIGPAGHNFLKPEIVKYWKLAEVCKPETARAILYDNAQRIWFDGWDMPSVDDPRFRQIPPCMRAETLFHNQGHFEWIDEEMY